MIFYVYFELRPKFLKSSLYQTHKLVRWGIVNHWIFTLYLSLCWRKEGKDATFWQLIFIYHYRDSRVIWWLLSSCWEGMVAFSWLSAIHFFCLNANHWRILATSVHHILHLLSLCYLMHVLYTRKWCWMWCPVYHINIIHIPGSSDKKYLDFLIFLSCLRETGNEEQ